jgi:putative membrane protein
MRTYLLSIVGAAVVSIVASSGTQAAEESTPELNTAMTDMDFLMTAAGSDEYERQAGAIAQQRGQHEEVQALGGRLIEDHTRSTEMLAAAATAAGLSAPSPVLHPGLQRKLQELQNIPAELFDQVFLQQQAEAHVDARQLMRTCIEACDAEQLRSAAGEVVEVVQAHLSHTLHLQRELEPTT